LTQDRSHPPRVTRWDAAPSLISTGLPEMFQLAQ
jgi:hypothetical protein